MAFIVDVHRKEELSSISLRRGKLELDMKIIQLVRILGL